MTDYRKKSALLLKKMRLRSGMTQATLARRMGTTQPNVARWESGRVLPLMKTFIRIAEIADISLEI